MTTTVRWVRVLPRLRPGPAPVPWNTRIAPQAVVASVARQPNTKNRPIYQPDEKTPRRETVKPPPAAPDLPELPSGPPPARGER